MLLEASNLVVDFAVPGDPGRLWSRQATLRALQAVSCHVMPGETLGIVGESGSGKSTLARVIVGLIEPRSGEVRWQGAALGGLSAQDRHRVRCEMQMVFQDPYASLDPRMRVSSIVAEPLQVHERSLASQDIEHRVAAMLERVGLSQQYLHRFAHELSGGQCQRVAIARALVVEPKLLICDEPVSALDVSVQAQIVNLLRDLQRQLGLAMMFISHNMAVVRQISTRVLVLYHGQVVEEGDANDLFTRPQHPYTVKLLASVPRLPA